MITRLDADRRPVLLALARFLTGLEKVREVRLADGSAVASPDMWPERLLVQISESDYMKLQEQLGAASDPKERLSLRDLVLQLLNTSQAAIAAEMGRLASRAEKVELMLYVDPFRDPGSLQGRVDLEMTLRRYAGISPEEEAELQLAVESMWREASQEFGTHPFLISHRGPKHDWFHIL